MISDDGLKFIALQESFRSEAYKPTANDVWTIGFGSTVINGKLVQQGDTISYDDALKAKKQSILDIQGQLERLVKVPLTQNQIDALTSLIYNIGITNFKNSTLLKRLNAGDYNLAAKEFIRWNKQNLEVLDGLTTRRVKEMLIFLYGYPLPF